MEYQHLTHDFAPVYDKESRILILGSFPSVKSRENGFYYGHPQNRFWRVLAALTARLSEKELQTGETQKGKTCFVPETIEEKKDFLYRNHIAVWDVIFSCDISGSSDSSIKNVKPNDLEEILANCSVRQIFTNGQTAGKLYKKYTEPECGRKALTLPSSSPANAAFSLEMLISIWGKEILPYLRT